MAGLAAAFGGFAQGYGQGTKLRSDMEDAESKRKYMGLQSERLQQEVDTEKKFAELQQGMGQEIKDYNAGTGVYAPAEGQSYDPLNPQTVDLYYSRLGSMAVQQGMLAKKNPAEIEETFNRLRKDKFQERVMQASQRLSMGDAAGLDLIRPQVKQMFGGELKDATYDEKSDSFNINFVGKDGAEGTRTVKRQAFSEGLLPMALNPADAAKFMLQSKEIAQKDTAEKNLQDWRKVQEGISNRELDIKSRNSDTETKKVDGLLTYYDRLGRAALSKADTDKGLLGLSREANVLNDQLTSVTTLMGIDRKFDPSKNDPETVAAHDEKLARANTAMYLIKNGIKDGKLTIDSSRAIQMVNSAEAASFSDIKKSGPGLYYVEVEGARVPIGITDKQYKALSDANDKAQKDRSVEESRRGGINPPEQKPSGLGWGSTSLGIYR